MTTVEVLQRVREIGTANMISVSEVKGVIMQIADAMEEACDSDEIHYRNALSALEGSSGAEYFEMLLEIKRPRNRLRENADEV